MRGQRMFGILAMLVLMNALVVLPRQNADATGCTCNMFGSSTPGTVDSGPDAAVTLGMRFHSDVSGYVTGLRFYKAAANTGTHTGYLWHYNGSNFQEMASGTFTSETASGWQSLTFAKPVWIFANTVYTIGYYVPNGHYSVDANYFATPRTSGLLHSDSGAYYYGLGPPNSNVNTNYWIDVTFETSYMPQSLWGMTYPTPAVSAASGDTLERETGMRFTSDVNTTVYGVRFWYNSYWMKPVIANLWQNGTLLATNQYPDETGMAGWHEVYFDTPVAIAAGVEYVVSVFDDDIANQYGYTDNYFTSTVDNGPLHAPVNAGVNISTATSAFPTTQSSRNYWVDPIISSIATVAMHTTVVPELTFTVSGATSACNGEPNYVTSGGGTSTVNFGRFSSATNKSAGQILTISGNQSQGFTVYIRGTQTSQNMRSSGHNFPDVAGTHLSPAALGAGEQFGYTFKDATSPSSVTNPGNALFVKLEDVDRAIMGSASALSGSGCVSYVAQTTANTPAGAYGATTYYTAVPVY